MNEIFVRKQNSWFWFKLTSVCLMIMVFGFSVSSFADKNESPISFYECENELIETQIGYIEEGIKVLNSNKEVSEDLINAVWKLVFSINTNQTCPDIISLEELESLNQAFDFKEIDVNEKIDLINAKLQLLNKEQMSEPTKLIRVKANNLKEEVASCSVREQKLFDILGAELEKNRTKGVTPEMILFLRQLNEELEVDIITEDNLEIDSFEELIQEQASYNKCKLDLSVLRPENRPSEAEGRQKEYLCSNGDIVSDKLLCPLN